MLRNTDISKSAKTKSAFSVHTMIGTILFFLFVILMDVYLISYLTIKWKNVCHIYIAFKKSNMSSMFYCPENNRMLFNEPVF